jgi:hypothetical protein
VHDDIDADDSENENVEAEDSKFQEPDLRFESIPHRGSINRIRSMFGSPIVATWNEDGEVGIYNVSSAVDELDKPQ